MSKLRHGELTYRVRGIVFEVRKELGAGWSEEIYHQKLLQKFKESDIPVVSKPRHTIFHRGNEVHTFECDLMVWDLIILELKVTNSIRFTPGQQAQLFHYLKCWKKDLGLLINFGLPRAKIERMVWDESPLITSEEFNEVFKSKLEEADRELLRRVRPCILDVVRHYGLGYPEIIYRNIIAVELNHQGIDCELNVKAQAQITEIHHLEHDTQHLLVANRYLLNVRAMFEYPPAYDFMQMQTFLRALNLKCGFLVNFGKKELQIYGIHS